MGWSHDAVQRPYPVLYHQGQRRFRRVRQRTNSYGIEETRI